MRLPKREFESLVETALQGVPEYFRERMLNVEVSVADIPGPEAEEDEGADDLMGLYIGPMREEMLASDAGPGLPARVLLYKDNIEDACESKAEVMKEVTLTLRHELAHHFGFDDEELEEFWPEGA